MKHLFIIIFVCVASLVWGQSNRVKSVGGDGDWSINNDTISTTLPRINIGPNSFPDSYGIFNLDGYVSIFDSTESNKPGFFFGDFGDWSTANGGASARDLNNFHYYQNGGSRVLVEFEAGNGADLGFFIEGATGRDAWYGLQNGATDTWSIGNDASEGDPLIFANGFGLSNQYMAIAPSGSIAMGAADPAVGSSLHLTATDKAFIPNRLDTSQISALSSLVNGMVIMNTTFETLDWYTLASGWKSAETFLQGGTNITLTGNGTGADPYIINAPPSRWEILNSDIFPADTTVNAQVGIGGLPARRLHYIGEDERISGLHFPLSSQSSVTLENDDDFLPQIASNNVGSVGSGLIFTNQQSAGSAHHWVFQNKGASLSNDFRIGYYNSSASNENIALNTSDYFTIETDGGIGIHTVDPSAKLHIDAGTATAGDAPLKFTEGTNLTTPEVGAVEWDGNKLYITDTTNTRNTIAYDYSGWEEYVDTTYRSSDWAVSAGDTVTLRMAGHVIRNMQTPPDIDSMFNRADTTIIGRNGDGLAISIEFDVEPATASDTYFDLWIDIGGGVRPLYGRTTSLPKGNGVSHHFSYSYTGFTLDTWETNGGKIKLTPNSNIRINGDIVILLTRTHKAR